MAHDSDDARDLAPLAWALERASAAGPLRERILASARAEGRYGVFADRVARLFDVPIEVARRLLTELEGDAPWQPTPCPGLELLPVEAGPGCRGAIATFARLAPGAGFPHHRHVGDETSFVLEGGFRDSSGIEVRRGEELFQAADTEHRFVADDDGPCVAASVAFGGIELAPRPRGE